jgi:DNA-dependent protein kinase catalytic subunit
MFQVVPTPCKRTNHYFCRVAHWQTEDQLLDLILCLKLLFGADPGIMSRSKGKPIFDLVWNIFMGLLDDDHPFKVKNSALDLLPVFICIDEDHAKQVSIYCIVYACYSNLSPPLFLKITKKLQRSYVQHFPPDTSELQKGTTKQVSIIINDYKMFKLTPVISYNNYISILDKLMGVMTMFKSVPMFKLLKVTFVQEKQHVHDETIKKNLADFSKGLGLKSFLEITQDCFEYVRFKSKCRVATTDMLFIYLDYSRTKTIVSYIELTLWN